MSFWCGRMGTLSSEFKSCLQSITEQPRIYADANVTAGLATFMRDRLRWDVLFVIEHDLRRASDQEHYRVARRLLRTLITFDRDFLARSANTQAPPPKP